MTKKEIRIKAQQIRDERLNDTGRACVDVWEDLMLEACSADAITKAKLAKAAEGQLRAAYQADKIEGGRALTKLREHMDRKAELSAEIRKLH